ncbi:hypothetical protein [Pseudomonas sp. NPDC089396]|uniref:hypothetical protein n=1 Tax=Pseudomonas sp. NPDC089396 TaxID=3364461 RepID=UPI0038389E54
MTTFKTDWRKHVDEVEGGLAQMRRSSRISLLPSFDIGSGALELRLELNNAATLSFNPIPAQVSDVSWAGNGLKLNSAPAEVYIDGLSFKFAASGHSANLDIRESADYYSFVRLQLSQAQLSPVYPKKPELHAALQNMSASEVEREWDSFVGHMGEKITLPYDTQSATFYLDVEYQNRAADRDAVWIMRLYATPVPASQSKLNIQVSHSPFSLAAWHLPAFDLQAGELLAVWMSNDSEGAQWRFAVPTVKLILPPPAIGEAMERGIRFWGGAAHSPIDDSQPIAQRFSPPVRLQVSPGTMLRRYTVHPGDLLSVLRNAQLESMSVELGYPLELNYQRNEHSTRTIRIGEVSEQMGKPAVSLPPDYFQGNLGTVPACLSSSLSDTLAAWCAADSGRRDQLLQRYRQLRLVHLANRASLSTRLAAFRLSDAAAPNNALNLTENLSAHFRSTREGALPVFPLAVDEVPERFLDQDWYEAYMPQTAADIKTARQLPIGLLYTLEFASELEAVLRNPKTTSVCLGDLTLSALGATGNMKASFDNGRTTFEVNTSDGQAWRIVKSRIGRIAAAWNLARHVVVYGRSTVPSDQFKGEQASAPHHGRPILRKLEEYIEILEPDRLFAEEGRVDDYRHGSLRSYCFATTRIYVNGAWGRDRSNPSGYEIALFNPGDTSGFYVKPWLGPVTFDASAGQVNHWHEHPEDVYFYSNTEPGGSADPQRWESVPGIDRPASKTLGIIADAASVDLKAKHLPGVHLAAVEDPRFAQRVTPQGQTNIAHGRSDKAMMALLRTVHIERSGDTTRLDLTSASNAAAADLLRTVAQYGAAARNLDGIIKRVANDARTLWENVGISDCETFKKRLKDEVNRSFGQAKALVDTTCSGVSQQIALIADVVNAQVKDARRWLEAILSPAFLETSIVKLADGALPRLESLIKKVDANAADTGESMLTLALNELSDLRFFLQQVARPLRSLASGLSSEVERLDVLRSAWPSTADLRARLAQIDAMLNLPWDANVEQQINQWVTYIDTRLAALDGPMEAAQIKLASLVSQGTLHPLLKMAGEQFQQGLDQSRATLQQAMYALKLFKQDLPVEGPRGRAPDLFTKVFHSAREEVSQLLPLWERYENPASSKLAVFQHELDLLAGTLSSFAEAVETLAPQFEKDLEDALVAAKATASAQVRSLCDKMLGYLADFIRACRDPAIGLVHDYREMLKTAPLDKSLSALATLLIDSRQLLGEFLATSNTRVIKALTDEQEILLNTIDLINCSAINSLFEAIDTQVQGLANELREQVADQATRLLDEATAHYAESITNVVSSAGSAIKLTKLLIDPPQVPHFTINTDRIECVFDDLKTQIETSPFVARLRELESGIQDLGMTLPVQHFDGSLKMLEDKVNGTDFRDIIQKAGLDFAHLLEKFTLQNMPAGAIRVSHQVDPQKRSASARVDIDHQFSTTEALFEVAGFSLDIKQPQLKVSSQLQATENSLVSHTDARFAGDWILNFGGQPLVTFRDAAVRYNDAGGFQFDLDPRNVEPHPALLFITQLLQSEMPKLPEGVKVENGADGRPIGVSLCQQSAIGPYTLGTVSIGRATIKSLFAVRVVNGQMTIDSGFDLGTKASPVFMQVGPYGGGGWLNARAGLRPKHNSSDLEPWYEASVAVTLGSSRSFTLASVATGSYDVRLFVEASISSSGNTFVAGLYVKGSARLLGYLNAYLALALEVEHQSGSDMKGRGRIDVEIEICWCYSVRVSRTVEQTI